MVDELVRERGAKVLAPVAHRVEAHLRDHARAEGLHGVLPVAPAQRREVVLEDVAGPSSDSLRRPHTKGRQRKGACQTEPGDPRKAMRQQKKQSETHGDGREEGLPVHPRDEVPLPALIPQHPVRRPHALLAPHRDDEGDEAEARVGPAPEDGLLRGGHLLVLPHLPVRTARFGAQIGVSNKMMWQAAS